MFCPKCGNQVPDGAAFCNSCGAQMNDRSTQGAAVAQKAPVQAAVVAPAAIRAAAPVANTTQVGADGVVHIDDAPRPIKTTRNAIVTLLLRFITLNLYNFWFIYTIAKDTNTICSDDDEKTGGMLFFILLNLITFGIYSWYWEYKLGNRLQRNAPAFNVIAPRSGGSILLFDLLSTVCLALNFIIPVVPFIGTIVFGYMALNGIISDINALAVGYNQRNGFPVPYSG